MCQKNGFGLLSRVVVAAEVVDDDGAIGLLVGSSPADLAVWDRVGMLRYALLDVEADVAASRRNGGNEEE
ncbi:hypothetical protein Sipo8835_23070 [Streptomyces ipomoeae]|uniref:Uncharacterized protein n=1 Tax=Streptomyces ipomoeae TaxID=103232 RepID=A0AAE9AZP7_9ACTN|nr:hypothetical protein [Streptomyces ipomoeae]TQE30877.1 hypothetical protein Sipo8835_23070 [Streptomyces ipomoeae]